MTDLYNFRIVSGGVPLVIDDGAPYAVVEEDGLTLAPATWIRERGPQQHGATSRGYRLEPRPINLVLTIFWNDPDDFWAYRDALIRKLAPYNNPAIDVILSNGATRRIDVDLISMVMGSKDREGLSQDVGLALEGPDPSFYDPTGAAETFELGGGSDAFEVPMAVPTGIGTSEIDQVKTIDYTGSWRTNPLIRITGPIDDPIVQNETTGEVLDFTGTSLAGGEYLEIDTRYGRKSVVDEAGANQIALLSEDSDLGTFHLEPGDNDIRVTGTAVNAASQVVLSFYVRYLGI